MGMIDGTEKWLRSTVWYASYQKSIAAGKSEREAIDIASSLVHRTQSVTDPFSMSQLQARRDPFTRLALMFTTDLFHYWNIIYGDIFYDIKQKNWRKAASRSLGVLSSAALMAFLSGKGLPDDEDDEPFEIDEYLKEFLVNGIQYLVPIAGSKIPNQINGYSSAFSTLPQDIWQAGSMIYNSVTGNRTYSPDEYVAQVYDVLAGGVSAVFPFPQVAVSRLPQTFWDNEEGFTFNPGYLFGTSYGRAWDAIGIMEALQ